MAVLEKLIGVMAPHHCLVCDAEGAVLCVDCRLGVQPVPGRCYRCRKASIGGRTCESCRGASKLYRVKVAANYEGTAKQLVQTLKFSGTRAAALAMAELMSDLWVDVDEPSAVYLVHVPTAASRVRQRGYDQAELLARALSRRTGIRALPVLARLGHTRQVGTKREERLAQLEHAFRPRHAKLIEGAHLIFG